MAEGLNPAQQAAVDHGDGPLCVLAGAGSGKTRVLVHRIERLVESGTWPQEILAVTFSNKAAGEMRERLRQVCGPAAQMMWIGTFHATCARLLRIHHVRAGLSRDFSIFDDDDQMRLVNGLLKEQGLADAVTPRTILSLIDRAKNRGADPAALGPGRTYAHDLVAQVYPLYRAALAREDAVDFNDLLLKVLELADDPEAGPELARRFRHVLVDEFQDTNLVQYRLVRHMASRTGNLTVVGDDDQAIYGWRGAEPRNLLDFELDFPDAVVVKLEQNYRSTSVILGAANGVISRNLDRHAKRLWTEQDGGEPILWEEAPDDRSEADFVGRAMRGLTNEEGRTWGDLAVLYRTHSQSRVLEEAMRAHRIPYRIVGGVSFFQRREIKDIRAYLRLVLNTSADSCFERVVNVPARGIGDTTIERVRAHARLADISLLDAARSCSHGAVAALKPSARKKLAAFVDIIDGLREVQAAGASVSELIIQAVERSGYRERLAIEDTPDSRDRLGNLGELVSMAADFDDDAQKAVPDDAASRSRGDLAGPVEGGGGTLAAFEERISLASALDEQDGRGTAVTLMTIHAAKGLEFPVVFVCGMEDGLFPSLRPRDNEDERKSLEEERRLAYVAFTRAKQRLILTSARVRRQWAEVKMNRPSRFLDDIPSEHLAVRAPAAPPRPPAGSLVRAPRPARPARDELDQRVDYDDVPVIHIGGDAGSGGGGHFPAGSAVRHDAFGTGRVLESRGSGRDLKLLIDFPTVGLKTVLARFVQPLC
ncbi:MAG TPA: UvrD-helicase domain-containing protein [Kofleriaceae bacterium]|nr:UvrD-helicase domain-containing protein [Kofleriaceae bacterium]